MVKYILFLFVLLFTSPAKADQSVPDLVGIHLGSTTKQAEQACEKHHGKWFSSQVGLFSCRGAGYSVTVETTDNNVVYSIYVSFKQVKIYNKELNSFDGHGNFAMGVKEHIIFPEIDYDKIDRVWGMDIIVCTSAKTDDEARALLTAFNFPFRKSHRQAA
jgi:hypothetical protein